MFYWEDEGLTAHDVMALVMERGRRVGSSLEPRRAPSRSAGRLNGLLLEAAISFDATEVEHLVHRATPGSVPLRELFGGIALPLGPETLPLA
jgi:hypothetical protein